MASSWLRSARVWLRSALILGAVAAPVILMAGPAQAALSGGNWTAVTLPAGFDLAIGDPMPVSCVRGTKFCVAVAYDDDVTGPNDSIGQGDLVTTDGGRRWTGYTDLPSASIYVTAISCPTVSECWASGPGPQSQPELAKSTDGGQTWTLVTPADWASESGWWPNDIDCTTVSTCWLVGTDQQGATTPVVAETTDGGATWTTFSNLPAGTPDSWGDTYGLNGISCVSARICVAVGGINGGPGPAAVISTTDGGATWSMSADPELANSQNLFSVSCVPGPSTVSPLICHAAGTALEAAGPVEMTSRNGGANWSGLQTFDNTGWLNSIFCADAAHCWAAGAGTTVGLVGTSNGGASWSTVTSDTTNEVGSISCASVDLCVATTDNDLWVTTNDGGL